MTRVLVGLLLCVGSGVACSQATPTSLPENPSSRSTTPAEKPYDEPPKLLSSPDPEYTEDARRHHIAGSVQVKVHITTDGKVNEAVLLHGVGYGLDEAAIKAVKQYIFRPALKNGKPVECIL